MAIYIQRGKRKRYSRRKRPSYRRRKRPYTRSWVRYSNVSPQVEPRLQPRLQRLAQQAAGITLMAGTIAGTLQALELYYPNLMVYLRSLGLRGAPLAKMALANLADKGLWAGGKVYDAVRAGYMRARARWERWKAPVGYYSGGLVRPSPKRRSSSRAPYIRRSWPGYTSQRPSPMDIDDDDDFLAYALS